MRGKTLSALPVTSIVFAIFYFSLQALAFYGSLSSSVFIPGTDGYFLLSQAQELLESGRLRVYDGGLLAFPLAALLKFGMSGESAAKWVLAFNFAALQTSFAVFFYRNLRTRLFCFLVLGMSLTALPLYHAIEFPKMTMATVLFPLWFVETPKAKLLGVTVASFLHKAFLPFVGILFAARFVPKFFYLAVAAALTLLFFNSSLFTIVNNNEISLSIRSEVLFAFVMLFILAITHRRRPSAALLAGTLLLFLLPSTAPFDEGQRLALLAAVLTPLVVAQAFKTHPISSEVRTKWLVAIIAPMLVSFRSLAVFERDLPQIPYHRFEKIVSTLEPKKIEMLIAARPLKFFYTARTGQDAFPFDPELHWPKDRIWRVVFDVEGDEYGFKATEGCLFGEENASTIADTGALLVREDCWEMFRRSISENELPGLYARVFHNSRNPSQRRPERLRERNKQESSNPFSAY